MKKLVLVLAASLVLAGCDAISGAGGGGQKTAMIKACTDSGEPEADCSCLANTLEKGLDAETFKAVATAIASGDSGIDDMMAGLAPEKQRDVTGALLTAGMSCMAASEGG